MAKPLKIIRKVAEAKPVNAQPGPLTTAKKKPLKLVKPLSPRGQAAIQDILKGKPAKEAMINAGFSPKTAHNPSRNLLYQPGAKEEIDNFVKGLIHHRDEVMEAMRESYQDASYSELAMSLNNLIKNIQLLTGKATGKMGFDLPPEQAEAIKAIISINTQK